ncbi:MAG: helix-turn-helix domain-containing protein [Dehalococcoidia bacterium]|jgi:hypothetical protein
MLKRLLALIADGGRTWSSELLARELGVPSPMVDDLLARLVSEGYLSCASPAASSACAGCSLRSPACDEASGPTLWQLTDKARRLVSAATA